MVAAVGEKRPIEEQNLPVEVTPSMESIVTESAKRTRLLFSNNYGQPSMDEMAR